MRIISNSGDLFVFFILIGIYLFNSYKHDKKKAWGLLLVSDVIAVIVAYPKSLVEFFLVIFSIFFLSFVFFLMDKYDYLRYFGGVIKFRSSGGGFGGGFGGFGGGRSGGGGFGGKW